MKNVLTHLIHKRFNKDDWFVPCFGDIIFVIPQVRMGLFLVRRLNVRPADLVILTQYRLQKYQIEAALKTEGQEDITVSTVITSQGNP